MEWAYVLGVIATAAVFGAVMVWLAPRIAGSRIGFIRAFFAGLVVFLIASPIVTVLASDTGLDSLQLDSFAGAIVAIAVVGLGFAWAFAIGMAALALAEAVVPTGSVPGPVQFAALVRRRLLASRRMWTVSNTLARHGLRALVRGLAPGAESSQLGTRLADALEQAGGAFVKFGQLLSARPDLVPDTIAEPLSRLQSKVAPVSLEALLVAEPVLVDAEVFASIEQEPIATASIAQVHRAALVDGSSVVVKVRRPDALAAIEGDCALLDDWAARIATTDGWARQRGFDALAHGFTRSLRGELDLQREAQNTALAARLSSTPGVRVPRIYDGFGSAGVIVMEAAGGIPIGGLTPPIAELSPDRVQQLVTQLAADTIRRMLQHGVFHADLHPGNVMLDTEGLDGDGQQGVLWLIDFGATGVLDRPTRDRLIRLLLASVADDPLAATEALIALAGSPDSVDASVLSSDLGRMLTLANNQEGPAALAELTHGLFALLREHALMLPGDVAGALRSVAGLQGIVHQLAPETDLIATLEREIRSILESQVRTSAGAAAAVSNAVSLVHGVRELPARMAELSSLASKTVDRPLLSPRFHHDMLGIALAAVSTFAALGLLAVPSSLMLTPELSVTEYAGGAVGLVAFALGCRAFVRFVSLQTRSHPLG